ncbi:MAG: hypothetical protein HN431_13835, partial [Bacteroidetes bacterium]|nr:hypothetical protein [Bacteroidota bacterium]
SKRRGGNGVYDIYMIEPKMKKKIEKKEDFFVDADDNKLEKQNKEPEPDIVTRKEEPVDIIAFEKENKSTATDNSTATSSNELSESQLFNASIDELHFKVQIGAYKNHITKYHKIFTEKLDPQEINEEQWPPDMLYKYTIGQQFTITSATNYKLEIRSLGYKDAFLTCYYKTERIPMSEAKELIRKYYRIN